MQLALPSGPGLSSGPLPASPFPKRMLIAGVTMAGATAIALNPVTPTLPTLHEIQDRAVALYAWENPLTVWQNTIQTSLGHIQYGINAIGTETIPALQAILQASPELLSEIVGGLTNTAGLQQLASDLPGYLNTITTGMQGSAAGFQEWLGELPTYLGAAAEAASQGNFTEALQNINWWTLFAIGEVGWPLFESLEIPGDIAASLGMGKLANVFDALFTNNAAGNYTEAILAPFITAAFQFTEVLDSIVASVKTGDWETALSGIVNMPAKVIGAYLNGYTPSFTSYAWPGLLTAGGTLESFLFKIPNAIKWALSLEPQTATTATTLAAATSELDKVASTDVAATATLLTLDTTAAGTEAAVDAVAGTEVATEAAAVETPAVDAAVETPAVEAVAETPLVETPAVETVVETPAVEAVVAETPAAEVTTETPATATTPAAVEAAAPAATAPAATPGDDAGASDDAKADKGKGQRGKDKSDAKGKGDRAKGDRGWKSERKAQSAKSDTASSSTGSASTGSSSTGSASSASSSSSSGGSSSTGGSDSGE